jgi:PAT family beta-lactamase induction signal transducer AmpG
VNEASQAAASEQAPPKGFRLVAAAFTHRKTADMLVQGMAAGLPNVLLLGSLYAWLGEAGVNLETMGVFSLIGLAYAFKFLWSPVVDRVRLPGLWRLGRRRSWLIPIQALVGVVLLGEQFTLLHAASLLLAAAGVVLIAHDDENVRSVGHR